MCRNILIGLVLSTIAILTLGAAVYQYFGWPGFLAYLVVLAVGLILLKGMLPQILRYFVLYRIRKYGKGLHKAVITRSSITPAPAPTHPVERFFEPEEDLDAISDSNSPSPNRDEFSWNWVEMTVAPPKADEPWNLAAFTFARSLKENPNPPKGWRKLLAPFMDGKVHTEQIERWDGSRFVPDDFKPVTGPQRLRFLVGFTQDVQALSLLYFRMIEIAEIPVPRLRIQADAES